MFAHRESFFNGYLIILANDPVQIDAGVLAKRLAGSDALWREIVANEVTATSDRITVSA